jgi:MoxR-like ATPase
MTRTTPAVPAERGLLRALGVAGWDALEPAILAALATESPILLIGPHGTAKTLLLQRLAQALGLAFRHYNASILSFDDLLGYPVPQDGRLVYLQTPATIWQAEAVLFDEVSRCRPELQNKLFPLIQERVAQGVPLARLRHRWAAMNPPPREGARSAFEYEGAEPLDVALADRFSFVLDVPTLEQLGAEDRRAVLVGQGQPEDEAARKLQEAVAATNKLLGETGWTLRGTAVEYTSVLAAQLAAAGHPLSTRRAVTLVRNIESLRAAERALRGEGRNLEDSFYSAARASLPDAAWGRPVEGHVLLAAHRAAWEAARLARDAPERALLAETDPLRRIALALRLDLPAAEAGVVIADGFSALSRPERLVTSAVLFPCLARKPGLPSSALEAVADAYAAVARRGSQSVTVQRGGRDWKRDLLGTKLAKLDAKSRRDRVLQNTAAVLMADDEPFELEALKAAWERARQALEAGGEPLP